MAELKYVNLEYYLANYIDMEDEDIITKYLTKAERLVDILTYRRITKLGYDNCTTFEQEIIRESVCEIANFHYNNNEYMDSMLSEYALNGVSLKIAPDFKTINVNGVILSSENYSKLKQLRYCNLTFTY